MAHRPPGDDRQVSRRPPAPFSGNAPFFPRSHPQMETKQQGRERLYSEGERFVISSCRKGEEGRPEVVVNPPPSLLHHEKTMVSRRPACVNFPDGRRTPRE